MTYPQGNLTETILFRIGKKSLANRQIESFNQKREAKLVNIVFLKAISLGDYPSVPGAHTSVLITFRIAHDILSFN